MVLTKEVIKREIKEGKIKVSLSYDGDEILASYLVDSAQKYIEDKILSNQKSL